MTDWFHMDHKFRYSINYCCCVRSLNNVSWSILCSVGKSKPSALAILDKSRPNCKSRSMKSSSSPVKGLCIFGHERLHWGQAQWSTLWWLHVLSWCFIWCRSCWSNSNTDLLDLYNGSLGWSTCIWFIILSWCLSWWCFVFLCRLLSALFFSRSRSAKKKFIMKRTDEQSVCVHARTHTHVHICVQTVSEGLWSGLY